MPVLAYAVWSNFVVFGSYVFYYTVMKSDDNSDWYTAWATYIMAQSIAWIGPAVSSVVYCVLQRPYHWYVFKGIMEFSFGVAIMVDFLAVFKSYYTWNAA